MLQSLKHPPEMHVRSDGALLPSSTRTAELKREFISNNACKVLIDHDSLLSILKTVYQSADETTRQLRPAQWFTTMNTHHNPSLNTGTTQSNDQEREEIPPSLEDVDLEDISIQFLCIYSTHPNWKHIVSSRNDYGQTMAHICVTLGYFRLLQHLSTWQIDLNVVDHMGSTALHYAYLFIQEECARLLIHSGAERFILDDLGRSPSSLNPSLEVRIHPIMEISGDSSTGSTPSAEFTIEMPEEADGLYAKHFLVQQWTRRIEDEGRSEMRELPPPRYRRHNVPSSSPSSPRSVACSRQTPSISSPPRTLPGAIPVSPAPLIEQSLWLGTETETEDEPPRMYPELPPIGVNSSAGTSQDIHRPSTIRLPDPAVPPPTPLLAIATAREPPSNTHPASHRRPSNAPDTPPIPLANPIRTPPRKLRSPRAEAIWAAIVDSTPDPPSLNQPRPNSIPASAPKAAPAPAPPKPKPAHKAAPKPKLVHKAAPAPTLPPLGPIYLLHFQSMTPIWSTLPTGTFWEFARYALHEKLDFTLLTDEDLIPSLIGRPNEPKKSNVQGIVEIYGWEGRPDAKLNPEDIKWAQELDWEAEAMVEGKGRMLGIGIDGDPGDQHGTRYGGRVWFCALLKCEGNGGPLNLDVNARITLDKPMMRGSCLFTRVWGSHRFLRLKLSKPLLNRVSRDQSGRLVKELKEFCARPIHILGREYHPLVEKENTVYYFLHGRDHIGLKAVEDAGGDRKQPYGMGRYIGNVEGLVQWWLAPEHNRDQIMSKLTTRLHLGLSDTLPGVFVKPENVKIIPDISTFYLQSSIQVLVALITPLQSVMASLSPTERGCNRVLLQEHVGGSISQMTTQHHPLSRFVSAVPKESSRSTRKTSKRPISKDRTGSLLLSPWPK